MDGWEVEDALCMKGHLWGGGLRQDEPSLRSERRGRNVASLCRRWSYSASLRVSGLLVKGM